MDTPAHLDAARAGLLTNIAAFIAERGISETTFGRLAVNDGKFVARLRSAENMTDGLIKRAHKFIQDAREPNADASTEQDLSASPRAEGAAAPSRSPITTTQQRT
jgi:hypothetical protein